MESELSLAEQLEALRREHRELDEAIASVESGANADQLQLRRLKKQKLGLKDQIQQLEDKLIPNIIA